MLRKKYKLEIAVAPGILRVRVVGAYSFRDSVNMVMAVREHADRHGLTRVLLDTTAVPQSVPDLERASLGEEAARAWRGLKVASVDLTEGPDNFIQYVATNRGANLRIFASEEQAVEWLMGSGPQGSAD